MISVDVKHHVYLLTYLPVFIRLILRGISTPLGTSWSGQLVYFTTRLKKEEPATNYHPYRHVLFKVKHAEVCLCWSNQVPTLRSLVCCKWYTIATIVAPMRVGGWPEIVKELLLSFSLPLSFSVRPSVLPSVPPLCLSLFASSIMSTK